MPDQRYRVLTIATHPVQYAVPLFRRLAAHPRLDFHVVYCSLRGAEPGFDPEFGATVQWDVPLLDGYSWTHVPNRGSLSESFFGLYNPGLWQVIRRGHYDAINCHVGYRRASFWLAYLAARRSGTAFLFGTDAASLAPRDGAAWKPWVKRAVWPRLFRLADQVTAPSSATAAMMGELGIPEERISLTHFVVDNEWWTAQSRRADRAATRAEWRVSRHNLVVLYCAKLQDWKRPADLLRAFAKAAVPDSILVFAGEGPLRPQLEAEASDLGIGDRTRFLGFVNQNTLPAIYSAADLFVLPSDYDPCPVVVCEAMVCGLPVILSDRIMGRFDLVRPGVTGDIYPCGDISALSASLTRLLSDRSGLSTLAANARARMETWSPEQNIAATVDAIEKAVSRRHRGDNGISDSPRAAIPQKLRE